MTHDELLLLVTGGTNYKMAEEHLLYRKTLRAVVELAMKPVDASNIPAAQVAWFYEGYNLALDNILDAIEKELG